jgi:Cu(I)/Ag(I) efflux system membrane fusion protein
MTTDAVPSKAAGPVIYYRDPAGKPFYSLAPKNNDAGQPYVAVRASEDIHFDLVATKTSRHR